MAFLLISGMLLLCAVSGLPTHTIKEGSRDPLSHSAMAERFQGAINHLALKTFRHLSKEKNAFFSPLSISTLMAMLYLGARGNTAHELRSVLGYDLANLPDDDVHPAHEKALASLTAPSDQYTLDVANRAMARSEFDIKPDYTNGLKRFYGADLDRLDFAGNLKSIQDEVNQWVSQKTKGKIDSLLDEPPRPDTLMILLNAVYFKGTWKTKFDEKNTKPGTFYNSGTQPVQVPMMSISTKVNYTFSDSMNSQVVSLPYLGGRLSMILILPEEKNGLDKLEENLTTENLEEALHNLYLNPTVQVTIPKFKLENKYSLNSVLQSMGAREIFGGGDLSGISEGLAVSEIIHKAMVEVNEEGSEAAAVSAAVVSYASTNAFKYFTADHPFVFLIYDEETGVILFMGQVKDLP